ncbi:hypothetical protein GRI69_07480 [Erythrobacter vulgaris]|uniref:Uncharacterized protein n=1 Tax=Qipengyuania vulgaris TaxID=291985 RepID=A0A844XRQ5_9SPHN|nr:hypothetical protein [Qipengyuania vulgaris]MXO48094.1 hypothetical protein [Qipengyuania vulgaris]
MKFTLPALLIISLSNTSVAAKPFHNEIPSVFHGNWGSAAEDCADEYGVNTFFIDAESVNYYESNDYLLIGVEFMGVMTGGGSGSLFNGRFTSRMETFLLGESDIRFEIDDDNKNILYRYPIGEDGEPIVSRQVRSVRCTSN